MSKKKDKISLLILKKKNRSSMDYADDYQMLRKRRKEGKA